MSSSLKKVVGKGQPTSTKSTIKMAMNSGKGKLTVWCVVEGEDDVYVYENFLDNGTTKVLPSCDENGKRGKKYVEAIVTELQAEEPTCRVFGIRDCDYTRYDPTYHCPKGVFLTDNRDVEMMMFAADSVNAGLKARNHAFPQKISASAQVCKYFGYMRAYNEICQSNCTISGNIRMSDVWDFSSHTVKSDWQTTLVSKFIQHCDTPPTEEQLWSFVSDHNLREESWLNLCRGHDMINMLSYLMIKKEYSQENILSCMISSYSYIDFSATALCQAIGQWAKDNKVDDLLADNTNTPGKGA